MLTIEDVVKRLKEDPDQAFWYDDSMEGGLTAKRSGNVIVIQGLETEFRIPMKGWAPAPRVVLMLCRDGEPVAIADDKKHSGTDAYKLAECLGLDDKSKPAGAEAQRWEFRRYIDCSKPEV